MRKRILFVMLNLYNGGAERSLINLLKLMDYERYDVDLLLFKKEGFFLKELPKNVKLVDPEDKMKVLYGAKCKKISLYLYYTFYRVFATIISKLYYLNSSKKQKQFRWRYFYSKKIDVTKEKYDIAISYMQDEPTYFVSEKVNAKRKICWIHTDYSAGGYDQNNIDYDKEVFKNFNNIVTISDICVKSLKDKIKDEELTNKICMLPNLTSKDEILKKASLFYPEEYSTNYFNILSIGRLSKEKCFERVVNVANMLNKNDIKFKWFIIGNGKEYKKLKKMINYNKLNEVCILLGTRENPYPYIKHANLIVQTSKYEGKSMVLDEAKILNKLIVTTNYKSALDQITNNVTGIIVDQTCDDIYNGIIKLYNNKELQDKIYNELKKKKWANEKEIQKYYNVFEKGEV